MLVWCHVTFAWIRVMSDVRAEDWQLQGSCCSAVAVIGLVSQRHPWQQMTQPCEDLAQNCPYDCMSGSWNSVL